MEIRHATPADLDALVALEATCFPAAEAAGADSIAARLAAYADHFWLLCHEGELLSFVDGMTTDEADLRDEMYENAALHDEKGRWQMIFGVNTAPSVRRRGYAGRLLQRAIDETRMQGRAGLVLTCKEALVPYYARFGFVSEGRSASTHGNVVWHQMRLRFEETP